MLTEIKALLKARERYNQEIANYFLQSPLLETKNYFHALFKITEKKDDDFYIKFKKIIVSDILKDLKVIRDFILTIDYCTSDTELLDILYLKILFQVECAKFQEGKLFDKDWFKHSMKNDFRELPYYIEMLSKLYDLISKKCRLFLTDYRLHLSVTNNSWNYQVVNLKTVPGGIPKQLLKKGVNQIDSAIHQLDAMLNAYPSSFLLLTKHKSTLSQLKKDMLLEQDIKGQAGPLASGDWLQAYADFNKYYNLYQEYNNALTQAYLNLSEIKPEEVTKAEVIELANQKNTSKNEVDELYLFQEEHEKLITEKRKAHDEQLLLNQQEKASLHLTPAPMGLYSLHANSQSTEPLSSEMQHFILLENLNSNNFNLVKKLLTVKPVNNDITYSQIENLFGYEMGKLAGKIESAKGSHRKITINGVYGFYDNVLSTNGFFQPHGHKGERLPAIAWKMIKSTLEVAKLDKLAIQLFEEAKFQLPKQYSVQDLLSLIVYLEKKHAKITFLGGLYKKNTDGSNSTISKTLGNQECYSPAEEQDAAKKNIVKSIFDML